MPTQLGKFIKSKALRIIWRTNQVLLLVLTPIYLYYVLGAPYAPEEVSTILETNNSHDVFFTTVVFIAYLFVRTYVRNRENKLDCWTRYATSMEALKKVLSNNGGSPIITCFIDHLNRELDAKSHIRAIVWRNNESLAAKLELVHKETANLVITEVEKTKTATYFRNLINNYYQTTRFNNYFCSPLYRILRREFQPHVNLVTKNQNYIYILVSSLDIQITEEESYTTSKTSIQVEENIQDIANAVKNIDNPTKNIVNIEAGKKAS